MKHVLALLAALALFAIAPIQPKAHAGCSWGEVFDATRTMLKNYCGADCIEHNYGPISGPTCAAQGALSNLYYYNHSGQPLFWDLNAGQSCTNVGGTKVMHSAVYWHPTTWQYFGGIRCFCSGNNSPTCYWE